MGHLHHNQNFCSASESNPSLTPPTACNQFANQSKFIPAICIYLKFTFIMIKNRKTLSINNTNLNSPTNKMSIIPSFFGTRKTNVFDPFSLDIWDPFDGFLTSALSSVPSSSARDASQFATTRVDWKETPESHVFKVDLPGLKKEEVKVEVEEGRILQISGERSKEQEEKNDKWHRLERSSGKFLRRFRLPENAKMEEVKASLEDGVLTVTVPKVEEKKPEVKSIDISSA